MGQSFRPGVGNIALYTEGKLREKIRIYSTDSSGEVNTAANVGSGAGVFYQKSNTELQFKSLTAGTNVTISDDGSGTITISAVQSEDDVGWIARSPGRITDRANQRSVRSFPGSYSRPSLSAGVASNGQPPTQAARLPQEPQC